MEGSDRYVLDEMESPDGRLELIAYRDRGTVWVGVSGSEGGLIGAIGLRTGSHETQVSGSASIERTWALGWGVVAPRILRAELRNDEGETFPAKIVPLPSDLEREYRAVWGIAKRCRTTCDLIGYDERGMLFDQQDPRPLGPPPSDLDRLDAVRRHAHDSLRYYATAYLNETEENRNLIQVYLDITANVMALMEADALDPRSMLARRSKIVDRYLEEAKRDPWKPPEGRSRPEHRDVTFNG